MTTSKRLAAAFRRRGGVEPVDVGQKHETVRGHHGCDARGEPVIIAVTDFGRCHGVVFVYHRNRAELEECFNGAARIEIAAPFLRIAGRYQNLRRRQPQAAKNLLIGMGEGDLSDGGCRLCFLQPERPFFETQCAPPERNRTGRNQDNIAAFPPKPGDIFRRWLRARPVSARRGGIGQQRGSDLDRDPPRITPFGPYCMFVCARHPFRNAGLLPPSSFQ